MWLEVACLLMSVCVHVPGQKLQLQLHQGLVAQVALAVCQVSSEACHESITDTCGFFHSGVITAQPASMHHRSISTKAT